MEPINGLITFASSFKHCVKFEFESIFVVTVGISEISKALQSPTVNEEVEALVIAGCVDLTLSK